MPHNSSQWINHTIAGGWATDYGSTYYPTPQGGDIQIPWCKKCENVRFYPDGSLGKYPGLYPDIPYPIKAPASSTQIEGSFVRNLFDYIRMGSSLTGTRKRMAIVGSWLYSLTSTTGATQIGDVTSNNTGLHHMTTFNDLLIIGGGSAPKSWDQTTFQSLAGTPPAFGFSTSHAGRHWAAGVATVPSRLYYSAVGNPEDWAGAGSGSIDIDPGDGDAIVGILSWKRELWVFKGPHRLSIHRIAGTSPSDFVRTPFTYGVSAAGQNCIFPVGDDFAFWSPRGSCHSLTATDAYGDYTQAYINYPILSWCRNPTNVDNGIYSASWQAITDFTQNITYTLLNNYNTTVGNPGTPQPFLLIMDWRFKTQENPYPRFITLDLKRKFTAMGMMSGIFDDTQLFPVFGDHQGRISQELSPTIPYLYNEGVGFPYCVESPALTYGPPVQRKTIAAVTAHITDSFNTFNGTSGTLKFSYGGRGTPAQTIDFTATGAVGLGTFVLGTDQLGGGNDVHDFYSEASGESTEFVYTLREAGVLTTGYGNDVRVKHFSALITPSGESLEAS